MSEHITLQQRICELIAQHDGLRPAARVLQVDPGYLARLANGEKVQPGKLILRRFGLRRIVTYERAAEIGRNKEQGDGGGV